MSEEIKHATLTVAEIKKRDEDYVKFVAESGGVWNANVKDFNQVTPAILRAIVVGTRFDVAYKELPPKGEAKFPSRWIQSFGKASGADTPITTQSSSRGKPSAKTGEFRTPAENIRTSAWEIAARLASSIGLSSAADVFSCARMIEADIHEANTDLIKSAFPGATEYDPSRDDNDADSIPFGGPDDGDEDIPF